jgi:hypothetical protein
MLKLLIAGLLALVIAAGAAHAAPPAISNLQVQQVPGSFDVQIDFDLYDADGDLVDVIVLLSTNGGDTWPVRCRQLTGDFVQVPPGTARQIIWDAGTEFPDFQGDTCRLRLFASDGPTSPHFELFKVIDDVEYPMAALDTVPYGYPFTVRWHGVAPLIEGLDPQIITEMDTIYPYDDGLLGFKWRLSGEDCIPEIEDCWHPRKFNEATGDSFSYFGTVNELTFNTLFSPLILEDGLTTLYLNTKDLAQNEPFLYTQEHPFVVNYDPETILLDGQADWVHPEDLQVYPYYTLLNDPTGTRYPFQSGDRIPDRTYVVFKALFRDDPRDLVVDPGASPGLTAHFRGTTGLNYSFQSQAATIDYEPAWPAGPDGWCADTLGFLTAPDCDFSARFQAVDEHGRRDGTPAELAFSVGYPPCVQCLEVLPGPNAPSAFGPDLECYDGEAATHPCFAGEPAAFYIKSTSAPGQPGREYLPQLGIRYLAIDKATLQAEFYDTTPNEDIYHVISCYVFPMKVLLHGRDDQREAWDNPLWRTMAWRYQIDYACDPWNSIRDGGGLDDISRITWGEDPDQGLLQVIPSSGLWALEVEVVVPQMLVNMGGATFAQVILYTMAMGDAELADQIYGICLRQLGAGTVRASALDQTRCSAPPLPRPARYHIFQGVRPPEIIGPGFISWRDCNWSFGSLDFSLDLYSMAQQSEVQAEQSFQLILQQPDGTDLVCEPGALTGPAQPAWHEAVR